MKTPAYFCLLVQIGKIVGQVLELDERILDHRKNGKWLLEFYAPWCGHCKKLEPIYHQVGAALRSSDVKVGKIDATRYTHVASEFDVRGYPTIKYSEGEKMYTFRGERSKEDILEFVNKAQGPAVRKIASIGKYYNVKSDHSDQVFFLYIGDEDPHDDLLVKYSEVADKFIVQMYFYSGKKNILPKDIKLKSYPTVLVFKDSEYFEYEAPDGIPTKSSLEFWVNTERYQAFPKVAGGNINDVAEMGKILVMVAIDENDKENEKVNSRIKDVITILAKHQKDKFHSRFQFLWMPDAETINSIMLSFAAAPVMLILDPETHYFYMPPFKLENITTENLAAYLESIKHGKEDAYGGTGFFMRVKRLFYDLLVMVVSVWQSSRWLFLLMFCLPTVVISIVCYSLCCMEPIDDENADEFDEDEDEDGYLLENRDDLPPAYDEQASIETPQAVKGHEKAE
ncbi:protein disulfide-isomerase TMX3-like [Mytilus galloprovincialis]|uniref:Thioredoxin domain-containing protein 10 n=1 Tax=Mytilus galloprovincialis TaxID=29158 RepID=A0A8B6BI16_MYTGA|nr:thioredoxin domain-containing protein 10 [Mytilus galloprovincialis]